MNDQFFDAAVNYILHNMTPKERLNYEEKIISFNNEEREEFEQIKNSLISLPLAIERKSAPESIKKVIFAEINATNNNVHKLENKRSFSTIYAVAASILITFFMTRYFYQNPNSSHLESENNLFKTVTNLHPEEREKLNSALCPAANGTNMSLSDKDGEMHYGKLFYNRLSKSSVIHICFLPKQKANKVYTLWLKNDDSHYEVLERFEASNNIQELNYLVKKEFLSNDNKLLITLENSLDSNVPSNHVMLANL